MKKLIDFITLFSSTSTLLCCALPALLVALGAGSVMASLVSAVPGLIWLSSNKVLVFIAAGLMLTLGGYLQWRARFEPCPVDVELAKSCARTKKISLMVYCFSLLLYIIGGFFAFLATYFL